MKPAVVVVGSFVQDLTWRCAEFPATGETVVGTFVTGPGGKGSNQAVAAARAGAATGFVGAVGRDEFALAAKKFHRAENIAARLVEKPALATGTAAILVNRRGQNQIIVALGANAALTPRDVPAALLRGARVVVCQHETNLAVNAHVFRLARAAGATTVLNPAPMRADFDPAVLAHTDVLIPNENEFVALVASLRATGRMKIIAHSLAALAPAALHSLCRALNVPTVIVTLGERGCFVSERERFTSLPAHRVKVVDTTGAGDAFIGGFAAGLVKFAGDVVAAACFGNSVAALSVTKFGTAPSMPAKKEIAAFLRRPA
ncbi:MAG: ribokinase [Opitutus sp.]|nr:ribokinase [Opitutus sp.]